MMGQEGLLEMVVPAMRVLELQAVRMEMSPPRVEAVSVMSRWMQQRNLSWVSRRTPTSSSTDGGCPKAPRYYLCSTRQHVEVCSEVRYR